MTGNLSRNVPAPIPMDLLKFASSYVLGILGTGRGDFDVVRVARTNSEAVAQISPVSGPVLDRLPLVQMLLEAIPKGCEIRQFHGGSHLYLPILVIYKQAQVRLTLSYSGIDLSGNRLTGSDPRYCMNRCLLPFFNFR